MSSPLSTMSFGSRCHVVKTSTIPGTGMPCHPGIILPLAGRAKLKTIISGKFQNFCGATSGLAGPPMPRRVPDWHSIGVRRAARGYGQLLEHHARIAGRSPVMRSARKAVERKGSPPVDGRDGRLVAGRKMSAGMAEVTNNPLFYRNVVPIDRENTSWRA
ncbi:MAG TPA: hypothetical protein VL133_04660 [Devosia sp.]|nr:hypothetical protein [Devosia sp.]